MLNYYPKYFTARAIICYVVTLILVSTVFLNYAMPFQFMLFGFVCVVVFFVYSHKLSVSWGKLTENSFTKKLFITALIIKVVSVILLYFYYLEMTELPHAYYPGDELFYHEMAIMWKDYGFEAFRDQMKQYVDFSDAGYCWWLALEYRLMGTHVLPPRIVKCVIDAFSCVLMYNLAKRNFGESVGRMTAVFCMLMPNMWYYCSVTLKETEMAFITILFAERADLVCVS